MEKPLERLSDYSLPFLLDSENPYNSLLRSRIFSDKVGTLVKPLFHSDGDQGRACKYYLHHPMAEAPAPIELAL